MRSLPFGFLLFVALVFNASIEAQQIPVGGISVSRDQKAVAMVQASLSALMGSTPSLPSTIVASGTATPLGSDPDPAYSVRVYVEGSDKFRWEEDLSNGTTVTVVNGQNAQSQISSAATPLMTWEVGAKKLENFPLLLLSRWLNSGTVQFHFVGLETIDGQNLNHISIIDISQRSPLSNQWHRDKNRGQYEMYLDPTTFYPVRLHYYRDTSDTILYSLASADIIYSDFRMTSGIIFPFTLTRYLNQVKIVTLQFNSLQPNGAVSDQQFQIQ
jgi:hypothetical protein